MGEQIEPRIEMHVHFDDPEKFVEAVKHLGRLASEPLSVKAFVGEEQLGLFEVDYRADSGRELLTHHTFNSYYLDMYRPERPSNFPGRLFTKVASLVGEEGLVKNSKGEVVAIKRKAFDAIVEKNKQVEIEEIGTKSKEFMRGLQNVLPAAV
jgi:hypothetical protein